MKKQEKAGYHEEHGAPKVKRATGKKRPNKGKVHQKAYEIYENRLDKDLPGNAESDWYQAEEELFNDYF
jgi:hypothetical protein